MLPKNTIIQGEINMQTNRILKTNQTLDLQDSLRQHLVAQLTPEIEEKLLSDLWGIIATYWFPINKLTCPVSGEPLLDPVVLVHPGFAPIVYSRASLLSAVESDEFFQSHGITADNVNGFIVPAPLDISAFLAPRNVVAVEENKESEESEESESVKQGFDAFVNNPSNANINFVSDIQTEMTRGRAHQNLVSFLNRNDQPASMRIRRVQRLPFVMSLLALVGSQGNLIDIPEYSFFYKKGIGIICTLGYVVTNMAIDYKSFVYAFNVGVLDVIGVTNHNRASNYARILRWLAGSLSLFSASMLAIPYTSQTITDKKPLVVLLSISSSLGSLIRNSVCTDILLREHFERTTRIESRLTLGLIGLLSLSSTALSLKRNGSYLLHSTHDDYELIIFSLIVLRVVSSIASQYLAARETANELVRSKKYIQHPKLLCQSSSNAFDDIESRFSFFARTAARISAAVFVGMLNYLSRENPIEAVFAAFSMYITGALVMNIKTARNPYRLMPAPREVELSRVQVENIADEDPNSENLAMPLLQRTG